MAIDLCLAGPCLSGGAPAAAASPLASPNPSPGEDGTRLLLPHTGLAAGHTVAPDRAWRWRGEGTDAVFPETTRHPGPPLPAPRAPSPPSPSRGKSDLLSRKDTRTGTVLLPPAQGPALQPTRPEWRLPASPSLPGHGDSAEATVLAPGRAEGCGQVQGGAPTLQTCRPPRPL